jgi:hypothetical protein
MRPNRSEMQPFPTCGGVTLALVAKISVSLYVFSYRSLLFSGKRVSVNFCVGSRNSGGVHTISLSDFFFVKKKTEQMQVCCDFC